MGARTYSIAGWPGVLQNTGTIRVPGPLLFPLACVALAFITAACYWMHASFATTAFLYFVIVVLHSLGGRFLSAIVISVFAGACLEFFFLEPVLSFRISHLNDILALATFLVTAVTISYLSFRVKYESLAADSQREYVERLYLLAKRLLAEDPQTMPRSRVFELFLEIFQMNAICLHDGSVTESYPPDAVTNNRLQSATQEAFIGQRDSDDPRVPVRYLNGGLGWTGAIGFEGLRAPHLIASPLAALATLMIERLRAHRHASNAAQLAETEVFRTAVLDALAHEFKTPLSTILTAVGGIQESGPLQPAQLDLAQVVESEATRLGSLTTRLVRLARLDRQNVKPRWSVIDLEDIALSVVKRDSKIWPRRRYSLATSGDLEDIKADPELLRLAISQLLDNASKYSPETSPVDVELERQEGFVTLSVWNRGSGIASDERERIFERFYRGENAKEVAGTGLGLYVVNRIAAAHGGSVKVESFDGQKPATVFRLSFPVPTKEEGTCRSR